MTRKRKATLMGTLLVSFHSSVSVSAFQPDLVGQAIQTASSFYSSNLQQLDLNEAIFAAVNLLDSQRRPVLIFPPKLDDKEKTDAAAASYPLDDETITNTDTDDYSFVDDEQPLSYTIELTDEEAQLFTLVRQIRDKHCRSTTIRISGGWVRDKLLNRENSDIDIVLDNMSGIDFARMLHENIVGESELPEAALTACNPTLKEYGQTKSKHLQTASLRVGNLCIDFCQLRFEKYNQDSRVPAKTGIASVVEDAFRRDLTINALYYNLNTNQVEDWTEQGLEDLRLRNIQTPMSPLYTLMEDPLRILRAIRFASQLSYSMDSGLKKAALDKRVRLSLQQKVSKERVGKELDGIFQTRDPRRGMGLLIETKLVDIIFPLDDMIKFAALHPSPQFVYKAGLRLLFRVQIMASRIFKQTTEWDESKRRYLWYAAFFKPFCDIFPSRNRQHENRHQSRDKSILQKLLVRGLKRPTCDIQPIESIIKGAHTLQRFLRVYDHSPIVQSLFSQSEAVDTLQRKTKIAKFRWLCYRILKQIGPLWKESLILALSYSPQYTISEAVQLYGDLIRGVEDQLGFEGSILSLKPLLNGSQIQRQALPGVHGAHFRKIMKAQEKWQVDHHVIGVSDRKMNEQALVDYLVAAFPQYH